MKKLLALVLWTMALPLLGQAREEHCPFLAPLRDKTQWRWIDGDCHIRTRADLDEKLANHKRWLENYRDEIRRFESGKVKYLPDKAQFDPLRADLRGAQLFDAKMVGADLRLAILVDTKLVKAHLEHADLTGANLSFARLFEAHLDYADLSGAVLYDADLSQAHFHHAYVAGANLSGVTQTLPVDLSEADLTGANLEGAELNFMSNLQGADLAHAHLEYAHLEQALLNGAYMHGAYLGNADLTEASLGRFYMDKGAYLEGADLTGIHMCYDRRAGDDSECADFTGADLSHADLTGAHLAHANLTGAYLERADLTGAHLEHADLTEAHLRLAHLWSASLVDADLSDTDLIETELWNADFEPKAIPRANVIARAVGLETLRWNSLHSPKLSRWQALLAWFGDRRADGNRNPILDLRKALHDADYGDAERRVNLAYHRMEQSQWEEVAFDWTCKWGADWSRPLQIAGWLGLGCAVLYWAMLRFGRGGRLYMIRTQGKNEQRLRLGWRNPVATYLCWFRVEWGRIRRIPAPMPGPVWRRLRWELRVLAAAGAFSLMSMLNLGVSGFDLGKWVRLIYWREYELQARGTMRTIAGVQSVVSFAMLALAVLCYFGHPFE